MKNERENGRNEVIWLETERTIKAADRALEVSPFHITDVTAPTSPGTPHDYYSNGDYWWPNPDTPDGLPYICRDGESNPANFNEHRHMLRKFRTHVANLAAAYIITKETKYAVKAGELLEEFLLAPATRMNPHLLYAQAIPGICTGRGVGIIDTLHLMEVPVAIMALRNAPVFSNDLYLQLQEWFADYLAWISTHPYGIQECQARNNHGVCWFAQAAVYARFTDDQAMLRFCRNQFKSRLLPEQMAPDGSFPLELARTKPYGYSIFILDNLCTVCQVLSSPTENLWEYRLEDGRGMRRALEYLYPYLADKNQWPLQPDIEHFESWPARFSGLLFAGLALRNPGYIDLWRRLDGEPRDLEVRRNIAIRQPLLWLSSTAGAFADGE